jgi:hypothetical protein
MKIEIKYGVLNVPEIFYDLEIDPNYSALSVIEIFIKLGV